MKCRKIQYNLENFTPDTMSIGFLNRCSRMSIGLRNRRLLVRVQWGVLA